VVGVGSSGRDGRGRDREYGRAGAGRGRAGGGPGAGWEASLEQKVNISGLEQKVNIPVLFFGEYMLFLVSGIFTLAVGNFAHKKRISR
jgi:hypothetical protein